MAKQQQKPGKEGGGPDPSLWQSDAAAYSAQSNSATLASMTGGDAEKFEGIVDYILMGEENQKPSEEELVAAEDVGIIERNYPAEVESECQATTGGPGTQWPGSGLTSPPTHTAPSPVGYSGAGGQIEGGGLEGAPDYGAYESTMGEVMQPALGQMGGYSGGGGGGDTGGQIVDHKRDDLKVYQAMTGETPQVQQSANAGIVESVQGTVAGLTAQIDGMFGGLSGGLEGVYSGSQTAVDSAFGSMFGMVSGAFAQAQADIDLSASDTLARIDAATSDAFAHIDAASAEALQLASSHIASESMRLSIAGAVAGRQAEQRITAGQQEVRSATEAAVSLANTLGASEAQRWRSMGRGGTEGKRDEARAQVAEQVSKAYAEDLPNHGQQAIEGMEGDKSNALASIDQLIAPIIAEQFPALLERARQVVEETSANVKADVTSANQDAVQTVETQHGEASESLAQSEAESKGQLITSHETASIQLETMHGTGQEALATIADKSNFHLEQKADQFDRLVANNPMIPTKEMAKEVAALEAGLEANAAGAKAALQGSYDAVSEKMMDVSGQAVVGMTTFGAASAQAASDMAADTAAGFEELGTGYESSIDDMLSQFDQSLSDLQGALEERTSQLYSDVTGALASGLSSLDQGLSEFTSGYTQNITDAVRGTGDDQMMGSIQRIGDEEAAKIKEPSVWDRIMSVVKVLVVIAIVIAIAVLVPMALAAIPAFAAASAGTAIMGTVIAGAIAGTITSFATEIVMQIAGNGWNPKNWDWKKIGIETLVGGLVGGLTAGIGTALKNSATAARTAQGLASADEVVNLTRFQQVSLQLVNQQGELNALGNFVTGLSGGIVGDSIKAASEGQFPDLLQTLQGTGLKTLSGVYGNGMSQALGLSGDAAKAAEAGFSTYMEEMVKEAQGGNIQKLFEELDVNVGDLGNLDLSEDYQPSWSPTW